MVMINSTRNRSAAYEIETITSNLFVQPKMFVLETLRLTDAKLESADGYDL